VQEGGYDDPATSPAPVASYCPASGATPDERQDAPLLLRRGVEALRANDVGAAIEHLNRVVELDPYNLQGQLQFGVALQAAGRHAEALERFKAAQDSIGGDPAPFLHAAVSHLAIGDNRAALTAASEACWRAPKLAAAHYAYGQAWAALGEAGRAEQAFAAAIQLNPRWADAWVNYGLARYQQGAIEDAKTAMRSALAADPSHAAAVANLGAFMRISGESEDAERLLRGGIERAPNHVGARLNLVADLLQEERATEAIALLDSAAAPSDPAVLRYWRLQQTLALLQLGRTAEARAILDELERLGPTPPALLPLLHWRRVLLALAEGDAARASDEAERMERALAEMGPEAVPEHAIMARYDLAKFWSGQGAPSRAFGHWTAGHKLLARFQPFSRDRHRAFVDASIESFSVARLNAGIRATNRDPAPVFIVGMPRSGTTLVEQILDAHRDVHGAGERTALGQAFGTLGGSDADPSAPHRVTALDREPLDRAAEWYLAELHALAPGARRVIDKMPGNFLYLGLVGLMLPSARIIHCVRDPRDIGLSIFTFRFHGAHGYAHDLADLGWYIGEHDRLMAHWRRTLPNPILTLRLDEWVGDFDITLERMLDHLELPPDANCARFYDSESRVRTVSRAQVRQPVNARGLGRWRPYPEELAPLIAELDRAGSLGSWRTPNDAPAHSGRL
jgi:tetratricopeptide (TPR) repeat protein